MFISHNSAVDNKNHFINFTTCTHSWSSAIHQRQVYDAIPQLYKEIIIGTDMLITLQSWLQYLNVKYTSQFLLIKSKTKFSNVTELPKTQNFRAFQENLRNTRIARRHSLFETLASASTKSDNEFLKQILCNKYFPATNILTRIVGVVTIESSSLSEYLVDHWKKVRNEISSACREHLR